MADPIWMRRDRAFFKLNTQRDIMIRRADPTEGEISGAIVRVNGKDVSPDPMSQLKAMAEVPFQEARYEPATDLVVVFRAPLGGRGRVNVQLDRRGVRKALRFNEYQLFQLVLFLVPEAAPLVQGARA
jgi:hypothetical protein